MSKSENLKAQVKQALKSFQEGKHVWTETSETLRGTDPEKRFLLERIIGKTRVVCNLCHKGYCSDK